MSQVEVSNLSYAPAPQVDVFDNFVDNAREKLPEILAKRLISRRNNRALAKLKCVNFIAKARQLTAILSSDQAELRTISQLIGLRRTFGSFDGQIYVTNVKKENISREISFVSRVAKYLYIPGLSYEDMLRYAARLRMASNPASSLLGSDAINKRVQEVLEYMDLQRCKNRVIPERPSTRGEIGGELRRLIIAVEIINFPSVVVLDDPARSLDPGVALHLFNRLKFLADSGNVTVITAVPGMSHQIYKLMNKIVLLSGGFSIYAGDASSIKEYFTSPELGYKFLDSRNPADFLLDIASGIERPKGKRDAMQSNVMQKVFESSAYCDLNPGELATPELIVKQTEKVAVLPVTSVPYYGYRLDSISTSLYRSVVVLERAMKVKFQEREVLKKSFGASVVVSLFIGYFAYGTGNIGDYALSLFTFPYADTTNTTSILFLSSAYLVLQQVINVHIICQKIRVFRYEQKAGISPVLGFWASTIISELIFSMFFTVLFCLILYYMCAFGDISEFSFYISVQLCNTIVFTLTTIMMAAIFKTEFIVRDIYLLCSFSMLFLTGFIFTLPTIRPEVRDISAINPLRWIFEALMAWKFADPVDGDVFLKTYGFESFDKGKIFEILFNFVFVSAAVFFFALLSYPNTLKRKSVQFRSRLSSDASVDSNDDSSSKPAKLLADPLTPRKRNSHTPATPLLFSRESSVTGKKSTITSQHSVSGVEGEVDSRGPTVIFSDVTYRVTDRSSPMGYKDILHAVSGQFDWGKFGVIMGGAKSGKSTLLRVLAGVRVSRSTQISGAVLLNNKYHDKALRPWQLCAYVGHSDQHFRDLSVAEIVTYSMKLRCVNIVTLEKIEENVKNALELLQLTSVAGEKSKKLTPGALKRLSIAEEIVHGPPLLILDEPITGIEDPNDVAVLMNVFREMVNQDRTVIATFHKPPANVFVLFDTLLLLSKGRSVFMGPASQSISHFTETPALCFDASSYFNPADFLLDVSGCLIKNLNETIVDAPTLELFFQNSSFYRHYNIAALEDQSASFSSSIKKKYGADKSLLNPILERDSPSRDVQSHSSVSGSVQATSPAGGGLKLDPSRSFDVRSNDDDATSGLFSKPPSIWTVVTEEISSIWEEIRNSKASIVRLHAQVLLSRAFFALFRREKLLIGSVALHIILALNFFVIMGKANKDTNPVIGFFAVNALVLILANVQWGFYFVKSNEVFLKENSRGLYSVTAYWLIGSLPYLVFRCALGLLYSIVVVKLLDLSRNGDQLEFFLLINTVFVITSATIGEALISLTPDVRAVYTLIPGVGFILFFFSGLMLKPSTLPEWTQSWLPSFSVIRWMMQGMTINEFENSSLFPSFTIGPLSYSTYSELLSLFGWGGKTKWFCLIVVAYNMAIFRALSYLALVTRAYNQIGQKDLSKD